MPSLPPSMRVSKCIYSFIWWVCVSLRKANKGKWLHVILLAWALRNITSTDRPSYIEESLVGNLSLWHHLSFFVSSLSRYRDVFVRVFPPVTRSSWSSCFAPLIPLFLLLALSNWENSLLRFLPLYGGDYGHRISALMCSNKPRCSANEVT